jgi:hypothetical protein
MHIPLPARSGAKLSQRLRTGLRRLRLWHPAWVYTLVALALLGVSQLLWLWHSWPVREVLDAEQLTAGIST